MSLRGLEACRLVAGLDPRPRDISTGYALLYKRGPGSWLLESRGLAPVCEAAKLVYRACVIAVDAPLAPPYRGYRLVERRAMSELGARFLPGGLRGMSMLSALGFSMLQLFSEAGKLVVETHPSTVAVMVGVDRRLLARIYGADIADSIVSAITAASIVEGSYKSVRDVDGSLYFPAARVEVKLSPRGDVEVAISKGH